MNANDYREWLQAVKGKATTAEIGATATCWTCQKPITYETRTDPGYLPRTGWSDGFPRDAFVCFSADTYQHVPIP